MGGAVIGYPELEYKPGIAQNEHRGSGLLRSFNGEEREGCSAKKIKS